MLLYQFLNKSKYKKQVAAILSSYLFFVLLYKDYLLDEILFQYILCIYGILILFCLKYNSLFNQLCLIKW